MNKFSIVTNFIVKIYFVMLKVYRLSLLLSWSLHHSCNWSCNYMLNCSFRLNCRCFKSDSIFHIIVQNVNISFFQIHFSCCIPLSFLIFCKCNIMTDNHLFVIGLYSLYPPCLYLMKMVFTNLSSNFNLASLGT